MQCLRLFVETMAAKHFFNGVKYASSIAVILLSFFPLTARHLVWWGVGIASATYACWWDIHMDWGLGAGPVRRALNGEELGGYSKWWLLRPARYYHVWFYYFVLITNAFARFAWIIYISPDQMVVAQHWILILGAVEILRRAQWAMIRLEWADLQAGEKPGTTLLQKSLESDSGMHDPELRLVLNDFGKEGLCVLERYWADESLKSLLDRAIKVRRDALVADSLQHD